MGWGLERVLSRYVSGRPTYYECRRCGTSPEEPTEECPVCEADSVVAYEL